MVRRFRFLWLALSALLVAGCFFNSTPAPSATPAFVQPPLVGTPSVARTAMATAAAARTPGPSVPTMTLNPSRVNPGGKTTFVLSGFQPNEMVKVTTTMGGVKLDERVLRCDEKGSVTSTNDIPIIAPPGRYELTAVGESGATASAILEITTDPLPTSTPAMAAAAPPTPAPPTATSAPPSNAAPAPSGPATLTLSPSTVSPGATVSAYGSGFAPNETVEVTASIDGSALTSVTIQADGNGNFSAAQAIPSIAPPGTYVLTARGLSSGKTARATLTIVASGTGSAPPGAPPAAPPAAPPPAGAPPAPPATGGEQATLVLSPSVVAPGGTVTLSGSGFAPNENVTIVTTQGGTTLDTRTLQADSAGRIGGTQTVPAIAPPGVYVLTARGQTSGATASATLTISASGSGGGGGAAPPGAVPPSNGAPGGVPGIPQLPPAVQTVLPLLPTLFPLPTLGPIVLPTFPRRAQVPGLQGRDLFTGNATAGFHITITAEN